MGTRAELRRQNYDDSPDHGYARVWAAGRAHRHQSYGRGAVHRVDGHGLVSPSSFKTSFDALLDAPLTASF